MKYSIYTNQYAYKKYEQFSNLDIIDAGIMECIVAFSRNKKCKKLREDGEDYFWISHTSIIKDFPMSNIKTKSGIKRRIKKLEDAGLIEIHKDSRQLGRSYYKITNDYSDKIDYSPESDGKQNVYPSHIYDQVGKQESLDPSHIYNHDYYTNNNNNNNNIKRENLTKVKPLTKEQKILASKNREEEFITSVKSFTEYPEDMLDDFINYWTERKENSLKMGWEKKTTFEIKRRLITWDRNQKKFDSKGGAKFERKGKLEQYHNDPELDDFDVNEKIAEYNRTHEDKIPM